MVCGQSHLKKPYGGNRGRTALQNSVAILRDEGEQVSGRDNGFLGNGRHPVEKEIEPPLPIAFDADVAQAAVVFGLIAFEEQAEIKKRLFE